MIRLQPLLSNRLQLANIWAFTPHTNWIGFSSLRSCWKPSKMEQNWPPLSYKNNLQKRACFQHYCSFITRVWFNELHCIIIKFSKPKIKNKICSVTAAVVSWRVAGTHLFPLFSFHQLLMFDGLWPESCIVGMSSGNLVFSFQITLFYLQHWFMCAILFMTCYFPPSWSGFGSGQMKTNT